MKRIYWFIFILFIAFTALGTVLHECGHWLAAFLFHLRPKISYNSTYYEYDTIITPGIQVIVSLSGPLVNITIGTLGYILLSLQNASRTDYFRIFYAGLAFFFSREIVVLVTDVLNLPLFRIYRSDEQKISEYLSLPINTISIAIGLLGICICGMAVLKLPRELRKPFVLFGGLGAVVGYFIWFRLLGPLLLPA